MEKYISMVEKHAQLTLDTLDYLWKNPESGYREWKTHAYLAKVFRELGYELTEAGNIPGFTALLDTGRPGPTVAVFGELDGLIIPGHPEADPQTGAVHACGHCAQAAALVGLAAALKEPGALDEMCGKILLVAVPAEELIEIEYRQKLREDGVIKYFGGKPEFLHRGLLDGVDLSFMVHTNSTPSGNADCHSGSNGLVAKTITFQGVASHAGGAPHKGVNALYAANLALNAINALRETFQDGDHIRVHPIITAGGSSVNAIPDEVKIESYIRGASMEMVADANRKVNRAVAACAAAMGAKAQITDFPGYCPRVYKPDYIQVFRQAAEASGLNFTETGKWGAGCSDMGDICSIMPALHPDIGGASGTAHSVNYKIADPYCACVSSAKMQMLALVLLLKDGGAKAKQLVADYTPVFADKAAYFAFVDSLNMDKDVVFYDEKGAVTLDFMK